MTNETAIDASQPSTFFRAGWNVAKRAPIVFVARAFFDLAALLVRVAALIGVGLLVALHLGVHVRQGGSILTWVDEFAVMLGRPESVIGIGGMLFTGWLALLLLESVTNSGIWSVLSDALQGRPDGSARRFFAGAFSRFPAALKHRVFTAGVDLTLLSVTIGTIAGTVGIAGIGRQPSSARCGEQQR